MMHPLKKIMLQKPIPSSAYGPSHSFDHDIQHNLLPRVPAVVCLGKRVLHRQPVAAVELPFALPPLLGAARVGVVAHRGLALGRNGGLLQHLQPLDEPAPPLPLLRRPVGAADHRLESALLRPARRPTAPQLDGHQPRVGRVPRKVRDLPPAGVVQAAAALGAAEREAAAVGHDGHAADEVDAGRGGVQDGHEADLGRCRGTGGGFDRDEDGADAEHAQVGARGVAGYICGEGRVLDEPGAVTADATRAGEPPRSAGNGENSWATGRSVRLLNV